MKRILLIALCALTLTSCADEPGTGWDNSACEKTAKAEYPGYRIYVVEPHYKYLAIDSAGGNKVLVFGSRAKPVITRIEEYIEVK